MTLVAPRRVPQSRKTALNSDALTGQWLEPGRPTFVIATPAKRRKPRYLEPTGDMVSAPLALHRAQTEGVGLAYSVLMAQYLALVGSEVAEAERREVLCWWRDDDSYGVQRVLRGVYTSYLARYADERIAKGKTEHVLTAVLACHREEADPAVIAARYGRTEQWVLGKIDWCMRLAHGWT